MLDQLENALGGRSWIQAVASILHDLASTGNGSVRAAEAASLCPGSDCVSARDADGSSWMSFVLICAILAVAGTLAVRAGRPRAGSPTGGGPSR
jgi:hypothetical protein